MKILKRKDTKAFSKSSRAKLWLSKEVYQSSTLDSKLFSILASLSTWSCQHSMSTEEFWPLETLWWSSHFSCSYPDPCSAWAHFSGKWRRQVSIFKNFITCSRQNHRSQRNLTPKSSNIKRAGYKSRTSTFATTFLKIKIELCWLEKRKKKSMWSRNPYSITFHLTLNQALQTLLWAQVVLVKLHSLIFYSESTSQRQVK